MFQHVKRRTGRLEGVGVRNDNQRSSQRIQSKLFRNAAAKSFGKRFNGGDVSYNIVPSSKVSTVSSKIVAIVAL
jgi:hypothetical protein